MVIGINALGLGYGYAGGMEIYFLNLVRNISEIENNDNYVIFTNNPEIRKLLAPSANSHLRLEYISRVYTYLAGGPLLLLKSPRRAAKALRHAIAGRTFVLDATGIFGKIVNLNRFKMDVIHFPFSSIDPSFFDIRAPIVLTIPDIQHEYYPDNFDKAELARRRSLYKSSAERADVIITISEASKNSLIEKYGLDPGKIVVTHLAPSKEIARTHDAGALYAVKERYSLPKDFLFYPAGTWPHKNHVKLLEALSILKQKYRITMNLVMSGIPQSNHENVVRLMHKLDLVSQVKLLNFIPFEDLSAIFNLASLLVFPSLFEGFGIPLVEAMSVGLPIACSNRTSIPEVVGNAGVYFDPDSAEDIAEKIYLLYNNAALRSDLVKKGFERVKLFSWQQTAIKTVRAYEMALKK